MQSEKNTRKNSKDRFKQIRSALRLTRSQMAAQLGLEPSYYGRYERGETFPGTVVLSILLIRFNVSLNWLISGKGEMFFKEQEPSLLDAFPDKKEVTELLASMLESPLFRHEILGNFHKFKGDTRK